MPLSKPSESLTNWEDEEEVTTPDLINSLNHIDDIYIDTVEIYEDGFEMIEQKVPLGDASKCVRNLLQIIQYNCLFLYVEPQLY